MVFFGRCSSLSLIGFIPTVDVSFFGFSSYGRTMNSATTSAGDQDNPTGLDQAVRPSANPLLAANTPSRLRQNVHLWAIASMAIAQPILNRLQNNASYLRLEGMHATSVILWTIIVMLVPVLLAIAVRELTRRIAGDRMAYKVQLAAVFLFTFLFLATLAMWLSATLRIMQYGIPESICLFPAIVFSVVLTRQYQRRAWPQMFLNYAAFGVLLFPVALFSQSSVRSVLWPQPSDMAKLGLHADHPCPVFMIVLDGLCGMTLLDEQHQIDAVRYPGFARLAATSNWYRNASTVHFRTDHAVPAILTGRMPEEQGVPPLESTYPVNLLRVVYETKQFRMTVFEPVTRLCPEELQIRIEPRSMAAEVKELLATTLRVYLKTTFPRDLPELSLPIPHTWFGMALTTDVEKYDQHLEGLFVHSWSAQRELQFDHMLRCISPGAKPAFHFFHVVAPHDPWAHLPSGNIYLNDPSFADFPQGALGQLGEIWSTDPLDAQRGWQRHLLQLQWVDTQISRILDQLQTAGILDQCLLVLTADHGMSFQPDTNRREPTDRTLPDILSVPLFIKYPGQQTGRIDDENVEVIDILPTVLDVLKIRLNETLDGQSLASAQRQKRLRKTVLGLNSAIITSADFPERFDVVDRMISQFGTGRSHPDLRRFNTRPELIGQSIDAFEIKAAAGLSTTLKHGGERRSPFLPNLIPCYFEGYVTGMPDKSEPIELALALNGVIQATTHTSYDQRLYRAWSALVPDDLYLVEDGPAAENSPEGPNRIQIFRIESSSAAADTQANHFTLQPVEIDRLE